MVKPEYRDVISRNRFGLIHVSVSVVVAQDQSARGQAQSKPLRLEIAAEAARAGFGLRLSSGALGMLPTAVISDGSKHSRFSFQAPKQMMQKCNVVALEVLH